MSKNKIYNIDQRNNYAYNIFYKNKNMNYNNLTYDEIINKSNLYKLDYNNEFI